MGMLLIWLCYGVAFLVAFGLISLFCWWVRYAILVMYMLVPVSLVFWFIWAWLIAIPVGLISDGGPVDKFVMGISHWLSNANWELIKFCLLFPFKLFIWAAEIVTWFMALFGA